MSRPGSSTVTQIGAILALGVLLGALNNLLADPTRRIDWVSSYPEVTGPSCPESVPPQNGSGAANPHLDGGTTDPPSTPTAPLPPHDQVTIPDKPADVASVTIDTAQARKLHDEGATFVDARLTGQYEEGHIAGAASMPVFESGVDEKVMKMAYETLQNPAAPIVVYCNGGTCEDSHLLAEKLWLAGCQRVYVYGDGYPGWLQAGLPTETGAPS